MKLTFSCHYDQLGHKTATQCYQTKIKQLNPGIYLKKDKVNWINVPSKAEIKIAKTNKKVVSLGPVLNCIFYRLKINRYSKYFTELIW